MRKITARSSQYDRGAHYTVTVNACEGSVPGEYEVIAVHPWNGEGDRTGLAARCGLVLAGLGRDKAGAVAALLNGPEPASPVPQCELPPEATWRDLLLPPYDGISITLRDLTALVRERGGDLTTILEIESDGEPVYLRAVIASPAAPDRPVPPEVSRLADSAGDMSAGAAREAVLSAYRIGTGEQS